MNYNSLTNKPFVVPSKESIKTPKESREQEEVRRLIKEAETTDKNGNKVYRFK